jgi:uncharacterized lipoprotein YajG
MSIIRKLRPAFVFILIASLFLYACSTKKQIAQVNKIKPMAQIETGFITVPDSLG